MVYSAQAELNVEAVSLAGGPAIKDDEDDGQPEEPPVSPDDPPAGFGTFVVLRAGAVTATSTDNGQTGTMEGPAGTTVKFYSADPRKATTAYIRGLGLIASRTNGTATYYHYDAHGNVVQLTDAAGTVTKNYTYDAFGVEKGADDTDVNPFRYCGEQYDTETGNYYLRARYYTPGAGRFTQEDPAMDGLNWYAYCAGNPVAFVDPSGLADRPWESIGHFIHDLRCDAQGVSILWNWLFGGGEERNYGGDSAWAKYMTDNQVLKNNVSLIIIGYYQDMQPGDTRLVSENFAMSIENGEQMIGYQYLHGTNADVGGFEIKGEMRKDLDGSAVVNMKYQWNDIIDPNPAYESDINKAAFAEQIPFADPTDYIIRISWHDVSAIDANGKFVSGWLAGHWIAPAPVPAPPSKGNLDDYLK